MLFILLFIDCHKHCILRDSNYFTETKEKLYKRHKWKSDILNNLSC